MGKGRKGESKMQYVIADTHFMHDQLLGVDDFAPRPFESVAAMDEEIIRNWNARVKEDDLVYHLGDIAVNRERPERAANQRIADLLARLNGHLVLIKGNHDRRSLFKLLAAENPLIKGQPKYEFHDVGKLIKYDHRQYYLTHYPMMLGIAPQIINLHGHIHHYQVPVAANINVGVDAPERDLLASPLPFGTPLSFAEVEEIYQRKDAALARQKKQ